MALAVCRCLATPALGVAVAMASFAPVPAFSTVVPASGFYALSAAATGTSVRSQDGDLVRLGPRRKLDVIKSELRSANNENTRFQLSVTTPYDAALGPTSFGLVVDGIAYRQNGSGASGHESSSLSFVILGDAHAKRVGAYLGTTIGYRKHPGHHLLVSFTPAKPALAAGAGVTATLHITNVGSKPVVFMQGGRNRAERDNQYVFTARFRGEQVADIGTSYHFGGLAQRRTLEPGVTFEDTIDLKKWFAFDQPGTYELHGAYYLDFMDPADASWRTMWEDYVSADFIVRVGAP